MIVIPAIDIRRGKVVRLSQGRAECETVYSDSPLEAAAMWADMGAELIHVVDLDAAIDRRTNNLDSVKQIVRGVNVKIELGGGIRDLEEVQSLIDSGIEKVVIGTKALEEDFISKAAKRFGDRMVVGIDAKDGMVLTKGWLFKTGMKAVDLARRISGLGIKTVNYTDISRDGMLKGPNLDSLKLILEVKGLDVIASGGVSTIKDVMDLKALESEGLKGMIIGKALYEKTIDLKEAIRICSQKG